MRERKGTHFERSSATVGAVEMCIPPSERDASAVRKGKRVLSLRFCTARHFHSAWRESEMRGREGE